MATDFEIKRQLFISVLRNYYFNHNDVKDAFPGASDIYKESKKADQAQDEAREKAFRKFYTRTMEDGNIRDKNGKRYRNVPSEEMLNDFMDGKPITLLGAGSDGMISISADRDELNSRMVFANRRRENKLNYIPKVYKLTDPKLDKEGSPLPDVTVKDWSIRQLKNHREDLPVSDHPPVSSRFQTWLNKVKKMILGSPTALWAPYERHLEQVELENSIKLSMDNRALKNELSEYSVKTVKNDAERELKIKEHNKNRQATMEEPEEELKNEGNAEIVQEAEEKPVSAGAVPEVSAEEPVEQVGQSDNEEPAPVDPEEELKNKKYLDTLDAKDAYEEAFFGKAALSSKQKAPFYITNEAHYVKKGLDSRKTSDMFNSISVLRDYAKYGHVPFGEMDKLPEHLANIYVMGKLKNAYPDRWQTNITNIIECPFDELDEYHQIVERFDQYRATAASMLRATNLPESIVKDPTNVICDIVMNPKTFFCDKIDQSLKDAGVFKKFDMKAKGIDGPAGNSNEKTEEKLEKTILSFK